MERLLRVARLRPLAEYGRDVIKRHPEKPGSRSTWKRTPLKIDQLNAAIKRARDALKDNPAFITALEALGRERALMYLVLVTTGLRKSELASLTVGQLDFSGTVAFASLDAADEKNRQGSSIPLRADVAAELQAWLTERLVALQSDQPGQAALPQTMPLFRVPSGLARILDRDLDTAGIPKRDERGRVIDVHALRVSFCSHLCAAGVPLRTAQAAMRHSKPELTANIYTDPKLLDVAGAIESLPAFGNTHAANAGQRRPTARRKAASA